MATTSWNNGQARYLEVDFLDLDLGLVTDADEDLFADFFIPIDGSTTLQAEFIVAQDSRNLKAVFRPTQEALFAKFSIIINGSTDLKAEFTSSTVTATPLNTWNIFRINQQYDITGWKGISFMWWGSGGWDQLVEFEVHSTTGYWRARFYDGPAAWREVFISKDDFVELGLDGTRPDPTTVNAFLWTYHTQGTRKVTELAVWKASEPPRVFAKVFIYQIGNEQLPAEFRYNHYRVNLQAEGLLRQSQPGRSVTIRSGTVGEIAPQYYNYGYTVHGLEEPQSKKTFYAAGRYWVFYAEGAISTTKDLVYKSSINGVNWGSKTKLEESIFQYGHFAAYFDGTYIHLALLKEYSGGSLNYRRGIPQSDGTILWSADFQLVKNFGSGDAARFISIAADINGYPFIAYTNYPGGYNDFIVTKSSTNDGTWSTDPAFPYTIDGSSSPFYSVIIPLANGNILIIWNGSSDNMKQSLWNGATWSTTTIGSSWTTARYWDCGIDDSGIIHLVGYNSSDGKLYYQKRVNGVWSSEVEIVSSEDFLYPVMSVGKYPQDNRNLYVFYYIDEKVYMVSLVNGSWSAAEHIASADNNIRDWNFAAPRNYSAGKVFVLYADDEGVDTDGTIYSTKIRSYEAPVIPASFEVGQDRKDLHAEFLPRSEVKGLFATFKVPGDGVPQELYTRFKIEPFNDLRGTFNVRQDSINLTATFQVGEVIDIYEVEGSTNNPSIGTSFDTVDEMTKTLTLSAGDKVMIWFEGEAYIGSIFYLRCKIQADGVDISPELQDGTYLNSGSSTYSKITVNRFAKYEAVNDGDVTFTVVARGSSSGRYWDDTDRHMILMHIQ